MLKNVLNHVLKKWWLYAIILVILIVILVPLISFLQIINTNYDVTYNYQKFDDPLSEIAKRHVYYEAKDKIVEIDLDHDTINSLIKDNLETLPLQLPDKVSIQKAIFDPTSQRLYVQAKYGNMNLPFSAKINTVIKDDGIEVYPDEFMLGNKKAPKFIVNKIPVDDLKFSMKYSDFDIPQIAKVEDIRYRTGVMKIRVQLDVSEIQNLALEYRKGLMSQIADFEGSQSDPVVTFIEKVLSTDVMSEAKFSEYVEQLLNNEELINSGIQFALSDTQKYINKYNEIQQSVMKWAEPLQIVKYYGTLEDTVENILYDEDLKQMLTWFIPESDLEEYTTVAEEYYGTYQKANSTFSTLSSAFEGGNVENIIDKITNTQELPELLSLIFPEDTVNEYLTTTKEYYSMYKDAKNSFESSVAQIDAASINQAVKDAISYTGDIEEGRKIVLDYLDAVDTEITQTTVASLEKDVGGYVEANIDPYYYQQFKDYVDNLDENKNLLYSTIKDTDLSVVQDSSEAVNDINDDILYVIELLKSKQYDKVLDIIVNNKIRFNEAKNVVDKYSGV